MGSLFDGVESADATGGGVYFEPGLYKVEILKAFTRKARKGHDCFIVETQILESDCPERKPGMSCSWVVNLSHDPALGNIKAFIAAASGLALNKITPDVCEDAVAEDNPLEGKILKLEASHTTTRSGGTFTVHRWSAAEA